MKETEEKLYTRAEVQKWRDDAFHAAADIVERALPGFGEGDWSWLVDSIRGMASRGAANDR